MKTDEERLINRLYSKKKSEAKRRNINFDLHKNEFKKLSLGPCKYCGAPGSNTLNYLGLVLEYNGLDRKSSAKGYTSSNTVACCRFCNSLKGSMKWETWADYINSIVLHNLGFPPFSLSFADSERSRKSFYSGR